MVSYHPFAIIHMIRSRFFAHTTAAVILLGLLIFFVSPPGRFVRAQLFNGLSVLVQPIHAFRLWAGGVSSGLRDAGGRTNADEEEQLAATRATVESLTQENNRLRSALGFKDKNKINNLRGASVMYYGYELGKEYMLIDRGSNENVRSGDLVVDADGLMVGAVKDVEDSFAKVGIASNSGEVLDVELLPSGVKAFAKGLGNHAFSLDLIPQHMTVRVGDYIMAKSGPMKILVGEVVRTEAKGIGAFKEIRGVLLSHPNEEEEVFVVSDR